MGSLPELNFVKCKAFIPIEYIDFLIFCMTVVLPSCPSQTT